MSPSIYYKLVWMLASTGVFFNPVFASPLNSKLLSLVPPGAELVAGFENHTNGHSYGRLVLATHNDGLDLDDWRALAGVDSKRSVDEVIEVAATAPTGALTEHLLLVAGRFDKERIFNSAELNGAVRRECDGETVMLIKPFARELMEMPETRWLVILDGRIGMFGSQSMVQRALHRYTTHADIDMPLMERLAQLRTDVTSWNVIVASPKSEGSLNKTQPNSALTRLIEGAEVLTVGTSFGSKVRVDFSLHAGNDHEAAFFTQKAASFANVFANESPVRSDSLLSVRRRLGNLSVESNRVQGSVELSAKAFQQWSQQGGFMRPSEDSALRNSGRGE